MNNQPMYTTPLNLEIRPYYLDKGINEYSYCNTLNDMYLSFNTMGPTLAHEYCYSPESISSANATFDSYENAKYESMCLVSSNFESLYTEYCYMPSNTLSPISPVVKSNDSILLTSRRSSSISLNNYKDNQRVMLYQCDVCNKTFDRKYVLKRHRGSHSNKRQFYCRPCNMSFYRKDIFDRHLNTKKCRKAHKLI